ncbi:hypothetical protein B0H19DRAFT_610412 [Mycena capillaripes]|nr:hypothetical protein B0H19DRAFT_610412 [Mycena capillaripes]
MSRRHPWWGVALFWLSSAAQATNSLGYLEQTFYFNYNIASQAVPVPITTQCETIHLSWSRGEGTGPDPVAPYFLQIYTSAFVFPFIVSAGSGLSFDWEVPFGPGTLYQICMFDKNGNTGGCEAIYTMVANTTATPSCNNVTFPLGPLDVDAAVNDGALSQYGWVNQVPAALTRYSIPHTFRQCTDIQITPKNGTPPYIFTIAPTLHPPHNKTGPDQTPMNWTVNLSWGSPFFISVVDADMNFWAYGPLHSGQGTSIACLSGSEKSDSDSKMPPVIAVASGIGGLLVGLIAGVASVFIFFRRHKRPRGPPLLDPTGSSRYVDPYLFHSTPTTHYEALPSGHPQDPSSSTLSPSPSYMALQQMQREGSNYQIEPFTPPGATRHSLYGSEFEPNHAASATTPEGGGGHIYVVHHDAGRAPVTVYHQDGTEVVELPPRYAHNSSLSRSVSGIAADGQTDINFASDIFSPPRSPNRPRKP